MKTLILLSLLMVGCNQQFEIICTDSDYLPKFEIETAEKCYSLYHKERKSDELYCNWIIGSRYNKVNKERCTVIPKNGAYIQRVGKHPIQYYQEEIQDTMDSITIMIEGALK